MIHAFEDCELDLPRYELRYTGKVVKPEPHVFNTPTHLIQHRDRLVTKEEPLERPWPGRFVSEATPATVRVPQKRGRPRTRPREVAADKAYDSHDFR